MIFHEKRYGAEVSGADFCAIHEHDWGFTATRAYVIDDPSFKKHLDDNHQKVEDDWIKITNEPLKKP